MNPKEGDMFNDEYAWTHEDIQEILDTQLVETSAESKGYAFSMCSKETVIKIMIWNMKKEPYEDAENEYHRFDSNIMYNKNLHEYLKDSKFRERFRGILRLYWFDEDDYETMLDSVKCYKIDANQILKDAKGYEVKYPIYHYKLYPLYNDYDKEIQEELFKLQNPIIYLFLCKKKTNKILNMLPLELYRLLNTFI